MKLSILVCSTQNRYNTFLPKILKELFKQATDEVEILTLIDDKKRMLGTKRNNLLDIAQGKYVAFVDDDDKVSHDYIKHLLRAIKNNDDIITFTVLVSLNGALYKPCYYDMNYEKDYNEPNSYHRLPNHIMCVKREIALKVRYKDILKGEDSDYAIRLQPFLNSQTTIEEDLYYYDYNSETTETQQKVKR
ncbi:MAG: glycosyltransferase family 2 protein [Bacteroidia bacterium]|nr:glycosyltransferase family 2 protein [Bacteroidia bacterium]